MEKRARLLSRLSLEEMFTFGFQLNRDVFGMKVSNGVTYLFSFKKPPKVNYPMAYQPKQDSIVFYLFEQIGTYARACHSIFI